MRGEAEGRDGEEGPESGEDSERKQIEEFEAYLDELQERYGGPDPTQKEDGQPADEPEKAEGAGSQDDPRPVEAEPVFR